MNPRLIRAAEKASRPKPSSGLGKPTTCQHCGAGMIQAALRAHLESCDRAPEITGDMRFCTACQRPKPKETFHAHPGRPEGIGNHCADCAKERSIGWYSNPANKERRKHSLRLRLYGIKPDEYNALFEAQGGVCAICGTYPITDSPKTTGLHVDHDHSTGRYRGLLCQPCNHILGNCKESLTILDAAKAYLLRHHPELLKQSHTV